jgi:hypothetical protein
MEGLKVERLSRQAIERFVRTLFWLPGIEWAL